MGLVLISMARLKVTIAVLLGYVAFVLYLDSVVIQSLSPATVAWEAVKRDCSENSKSFVMDREQVPFSILSYKKNMLHCDASHVRCTKD